MNTSDVGQYKFGHTLGEGTSGVVKVATHIPTGDKVAVKIISAERTDLQALQEEVDNHRRLHHKHVVQIYDVIKKDGDTYIVMELVKGGDLFEYLVRHPRLPQKKARRIFQQIIAGLEHCHKNNIAHRDLKPENIFLDSNCSVKIGDFGLSGKINAGELLTKSCGSPNYAAPELFQKGCAYEGPEVDVWSCGVILFALLCGKLPFEAPAMEELVRKIKRAKYSTPGYLSSDAKDLLSKMICVDPRQRISIAEIREHPWFLQDLPPELQETLQSDSHSLIGSNIHGGIPSLQTKAGSVEYEQDSPGLIANVFSQIGRAVSTSANGVWSKLVRNQNCLQCFHFVPFCLRDF